MRARSGAFVLAVGWHAPLLAQIGVPDSPGVSPWRVLLALGFCLGLGLVAALALRSRFGPLFQRVGPASTGQHIRIIDRQALAPQWTATLIEVEGHRLLVVMGPTGSSVTPLPLTEAS